MREICDRYGVLLILDEVMCGMGRTGSLHACSQEGVAPDIMVIAKGLGGGYQPIGAMLIGRRIDQAIAQGSGFFQHGHTYLGHAPPAPRRSPCSTRSRTRICWPMSGRAATSLPARSTTGWAITAMSATSAAAACSGHRAGRRPRDKAPFDPGLKLNARVKREAMARGLMCYPMGGTVDGRQGDHVLLAPPYFIRPAEITELVDKLGARSTPRSRVRVAAYSGAGSRRRTVSRHRM